MLIGVTFVLEPVSGAVITTAGTAPRLITTGAEVPVPNELVQATVTVFEPGCSVIELIVALVDAVVVVVVPTRVIEQPPDGSVVVVSTV
jgi:hypothetical protein